jgi:hypothetical protein
MENNVEKSNKIKYIDPPSGWKYGFPKQIPDDVTDVKDWLVKNGYPEFEIKALGDYFFCRYWDEESALNEGYKFYNEAFQRAYGIDETFYNNITIRNPNPDYKP